LIANRENALKSTGPNTDEGKERSSMNAVKSGKYITKLFRITDQAGDMSICKPCGEDQQNYCRECKKCVLQDSILLQNLKSFKSKNLYHLEMLNMAQVAQMDFFYSMKIREVQANMYKMVVGDDGILRSAVTNEDMAVLFTMAERLGKMPKNMQLTRESQDTADVAWAELAKAQLNPEESANFKKEIKQGMKKFREAVGVADENRELDDAIQQHRKNSGENEKYEKIDDTDSISLPPGFA